MVCPLMTRMGVWKSLLATEHHELSTIPIKYLSMHTTSCAAERNLSKFGNMFDKHRASLRPPRASKMVFVNQNSQHQQDVRSEEEMLFDDREIVEDDCT